MTVQSSSNSNGADGPDDDSEEFEDTINKSSRKTTMSRKNQMLPRSEWAQNNRQLGPRKCLLVSMLQLQHLTRLASLSFSAVLEGLGMNDRNTKWRQEWKKLIEDGCIESQSEKSSFFTTGYRLTKAGVDAAYDAQQNSEALAVDIPQPDDDDDEDNQEKDVDEEMNDVDNKGDGNDSPVDSDDEDSESDHDNENGEVDTSHQTEYQPPVNLQPAATGGSGLGIVLPPTNPGPENKKALDLIDKIGSKIMPPNKTHKYFYNIVVENQRMEKEKTRQNILAQRNGQKPPARNNTTNPVSAIADEPIGDESVRLIQAQRYEIFFHKAANKGSKSFDALLTRNKMDPALCKHAILEYAMNQARKDPRLQDGRDYRFGNFSLITSYGKVEAQAPHIDLLEPNFQFGMLLTPGPGTDWYNVKTRIQSVDDLVKAWKRTDDADREFAAQNPSVDPNTGDPLAASMEIEPFPNSVMQALMESKDVQTLVEGYGDVLLSDEELEEAKVSHDNLPAGTVLCLPGSVVHAGPKTKNFRSVLFFSAWPTDSKTVAEYDPDTQYGSVFLCGRIVQLLWRQVGMDEAGRRYMLKKLYRYIRQGGSTPHSKRIKRHWAPHFIYDNLTKCIDTLEQDDSNVARDVSFMTVTARNEKLTFFNVLGSPDGILKGDFIRASVENLCCRWDEEEDPGPFEVIVYVRPTDKKVLLYYPRDNSETGMSWEGTDPGRDYVLKRINEDGSEDSASITEAEWFNGKNGRVFDADGDEIRCFLMNKEDQSKSQPLPPTSSTDGLDTQSANKRQKLEDSKYYLF